MSQHNGKWKLTSYGANSDEFYKHAGLSQKEIDDHRPLHDPSNNITSDVTISGDNYILAYYKGEEKIIEQSFKFGQKSDVTFDGRTYTLLFRLEGDKITEDSSCKGLKDIHVTRTIVGNKALVEQKCDGMTLKSEYTKQ